LASSFETRRLFLAPFATASLSLGLLGRFIFAPFATASLSLGLLGRALEL